MSADIVQIGFEVDTSKVKAAAQDFDKVSASASRLEELLNNKLKSAVQLIGGLFTTWQIGSLIKEATLLNARFETLGIVMGVVGKNAGYNAVEMNNYAEAVRSMGITMIESRNTVIRMAQAQLDLSQASKLARVAQDAAVIGGINSSEALERMVIGIQRGEAEILRTIGINVNWQASYQKLATELHKNAGALTENEKTTARMNAVLQEGIKIQGAYEAAMGSAGKQITSMQRYIDDLKVIMGETFNDALTIAVFGLSDALKAANHEAKALSQEGELRKFGADLIEIFAKALDYISLTAKAIKGIGASFSAVWADIKYTGELVAHTSAIGIAKDAAQGKNPIVEIAKARAERDRAVEEANAAWEKILESDLSPFSTALAARIAAKEADAKKSRDKDAEYVRLVTFYRDQANLSDKQKQDAILAISKNMYPEGFSSKPSTANVPGKEDTAAKQLREKFQDTLEKLRVEAATSTEEMKKDPILKEYFETIQKIQSGDLKGLSLDKKREIAVAAGNVYQAKTFTANAEKQAKEEVELLKKVREEQDQLSEESLKKLTDRQKEAEAVFTSVQTPLEKYSEEVQKLNDLWSQGAISGETWTRGIANAKDAFNKSDEGARLFESTRTPAEKYAAEVEHLQELLDRGAISQDTFNRALKQAQDGIGTTNSFMKDLGASFKSAFEDAIVGGKKFSDVLKGLEQDIERLLVRRTITDPLMKGIDSLLSSGQDWFSSLFANGGIMTPAGPVTTRMYASGGVASGPQVSVLGEGSMNEANVPLPDGRTIPVTLSGGGKGVNVEVNIIGAPSQPKVSKSTDSDGNTSITVMFEQAEAWMGKRMAKGEGLAEVMQNNFGLSRAYGSNG